MEEKKLGNVFDIQRFSVHDGPGIRTTVFLKGCPLNCGWCHNPEGKQGKTQIMLNAERCIGCGRCMAVCPNEVHTGTRTGGRRFAPEHCAGCGACAAACPSEALTVSGKMMDIDEVFRTVRRDRPFYGTEGGVTFSGGEVFAQPEFLYGLLKRAGEEGISAVIDTSAFAPWETVRGTLEYTDLYLVDIKAYSGALHKKITGVDNQVILDNLQELNRAGVRVWIRMPLLHKVNDQTEELEKTARMLQGLGCVERIEMMPYHVLGRAKYAMLGLGAQKEYHAPSAEKMQEYRELFRKYGLSVYRNEKSGTKDIK